MKMRRFAYVAALSVLVASGLLLRCAGLEEPFGYHPDERLISRWMDRMYETHSLRPTCYAGGFFVLADLARKAIEWTAVKPIERAEYFLHVSDRYEPERLDAFAFGRPFNAVLGTLAIGLAALLALRVARSRAAALTAAALMAFAPFAIEHAHYLESDVAMLASVVLALCLLARALDKRSPWSLALAAFATGFAAGTKFPLVLLLAPLLASIRIPPFAAKSRHRFRWAAGLFLLAAGMLLAGFVAACPDARHPAEFIAGLHKGESSVYAETARLLGAHAREPHARQWMNAALVARFAVSRGAGWLLAAVIGLPLCVARRYRPFWPVTLLFPALFLWYLIFRAPWLRSQEFMTLLPNVCLWTALPVAALWEARRRPAVAKSAAVFLFLAAALPALQAGVAMASQFAWEDTRCLANRTLKTCYPPEKVLGTELYTAPAETGVADRTAGIGKYESIEPDYFRMNAIDYVLLNVDAHGRGLLDSRTGKLFPQYADRMDYLLRYGQRLAAFGALASAAPQPTFRAPAIELWSCPDERPLPHVEIGAELPRPTVVQDLPHATWFRERLRAGPRFGLLVDKRPRQIALGGPGDFDGPVFLVFRTHERAATVRVDGFGRTARLALGPYDSGAVALARPWWRPRWSRYERVVVRSETGGPTLTYLPCYLRVAFDPLEAASILLDDGHPERAAALLREQNALSSAGPFWQAIAGDAKARPAAEALLAQWNAWLAGDPASPPPVLSGGIRLETWQDFARIRLAESGAALRLPLFPADGPHVSAVWAQILPVSGAPQRLDLELNRAADAYGNPVTFGQLVLDAGDANSLGQCEFPDLPEVHAPPRQWTIASSNFPRQISCTFHSASGGTVLLEDAQFLWNWRDMLAVRAGQLRRALAALGAVPPPRRYADWLAVRAARIENGQAVFEFEALRDFVPPFAVQFHVCKRRKWRPLGAPVPLPHAPNPWPAGECRSVAVPLPPDVPPERIAVALATDVQWHSSIVPYAGATAERPFPTLAELLQAP